MHVTDVIHVTAVKQQKSREYSLGVQEFTPRIFKTK
jgi:hypothetical protein